VRRARRARVALLADDDDGGGGGPAHQLRHALGRCGFEHVVVGRRDQKELADADLVVCVGGDLQV
jgi:hypothetical protein